MGRQELRVILYTLLYTLQGHKAAQCSAERYCILECSRCWHKRTVRCESVSRRQAEEVGRGGRQSRQARRQVEQAGKRQAEEAGRAGAGQAVGCPGCMVPPKLACPDPEACSETCPLPPAAWPLLLPAADWGCCTPSAAGLPALLLPVRGGMLVTWLTGSVMYRL